MLRRDIQGGGVEFTHEATAPTRAFMCMAALVGGVLGYLSIVAHGLWIYAISLCWLLVIAFIGQCITSEESIALLPDLGVQLEQRTLFSQRCQLVPKEELHGVLINEVIRRHCIEDVLIVLGGPSKIPTLCLPVFPYHRPDVTDLIPIYREAAAMFPT